MSILEQMENLICKMNSSHEESIIVKFKIYLSLGDIYYTLTILDREFKEKDIEFDSLKKLAKYLNKNGWKIYTENKS